MVTLSSFLPQRTSTALTVTDAVPVHPKLLVPVTVYVVVAVGQTSVEASVDPVLQTKEVAELLVALTLVQAIGA